MKKIYLVIAGAFLILLIITSILLSFGKKSTTNTQKDSAFPTGIPDQGTIGKQSNKSSANTVSQTTGGDQGLRDLDNLSNSFEPIETLDFKAAYVPELAKIVVEQKTPEAETMFNQWIDQNQLNEVINQSKILFTNEKIIPTPSDSIHKLENKVKDFFQLMDDLNNIGQGSIQSNNEAVSQSPIIPISQSPNSLTPTPYNLQPTTSFTYFPQCGDLGDLSLPDGCNLCYAGCGPTTVAMIAASYLGSNYNPKTIVDLYQSKGYLLGCAGSRYSDAKQVLQSLGLKTTDYLVYDFETADQVFADLKKYLDSGWTFFTLASFCDSGCGHYFWITNIDSKGNIWAYDPAYGRYKIPYNENSRYPYPLYRLAFGVKK